MHICWCREIICENIFANTQGELYIRRVRARSSALYCFVFFFLGAAPRFIAFVFQNMIKGKSVDFYVFSAITASATRLFNVSGAEQPSR